MEAILGLSPDSEPSPADLARLQDLIREDGVTTVFSESLVSPAAADALARDLGIKSDVLDPIEGLSDDTSGEDYLSLMRSNLDEARAGERLLDRAGREARRTGRSPSAGARSCAASTSPSARVTSWP